MTDNSILDDGWIAHDGGECPVPLDSRLDVRFYGTDHVRNPPYIRHHEMWNQEASTLRWVWIPQQYSQHHSDITHWRFAKEEALDVIDYAETCLRTVGETKMVQISRDALSQLIAMARDQPSDGWKTNDPVEQAVYDHYMAGSQRGDLFVHVKRGKLNVMQPERSHGTAYAAWMAGRDLAKMEKK